MCISRSNENDKLEFDNLLLESSKEGIVLRVAIDHQLTFHT